MYTERQMDEKVALDGTLHEEEKIRRKELRKALKGNRYSGERERDKTRKKKKSLKNSENGNGKSKAEVQVQ